MHFHILQTAPVHPKAEDHPLTYVFSMGDNHYFQFANPQSLYYDRFMAIQDRFVEADNRVTNEYLHLMVKMMRDYLNKGELTEIGLLIRNLEQRLEYVSNIEHLYLIASVWYFDQNESPFVYDSVYAYDKIALWQKDKEALSFFLKADMQKFFPSWDGLPMRIQDYTKAVMLLEEQNLNYHLQRLSGMGAKDDTISSIKSHLQTLTRLKESLD